MLLNSATSLNVCPVVKGTCVPIKRVQWWWGFCVVFLGLHFFNLPPFGLGAFCVCLLSRRSN